MRNTFENGEVIAAENVAIDPIWNIIVTVELSPV